MCDNAKRLTSRSRSRPSLELYKPPVLRGKNSVPRNVQNVEFFEENNQKESLYSLPKQENKNVNQLPKSSSSKYFQKSTEILLEQQTLNSSLKNLKENEKLSTLPPIDFDVLINILRSFFAKEKQDVNEIGNFLILNCSENLAKQAGIFIIKYLTEDCLKSNKKLFKKGVLSKIFIVLSNNSITKHFYNGVILALERYFECKDQLRGEKEIKENEKIEESFYFLVWQNFIFLTFELAQIVNEERVILLIFDIFDYLLDKQILNSLRISELESILSILMLIGNRLELDYPLQMDQLRILLRNASLNAKESWERKMILLMIELSIVNWKIVPQIEEFYYTI